MTKIENGIVVNSDGTFASEVTIPAVPGSPSTFTQTYSTSALTVPAATATTAPAGGTGATAGAWDTAAHRDAAIVTINALIDDNLALRKTQNAIIDILQAAGFAL